MRQSTAILPGENIGYTWYRDSASGLGYTTGDTNAASLVCREPFMFTGIFRDDNPTSFPSVQMTVLESWPIGSPLGDREWGDYLVDRYPTIGSIPAGADIVVTDYVSPGFAVVYHNTYEATDGWSSGWAIVIPEIGLEMQLCEFQKVSGTSTTLRATIENTDNVSHKYLIWKDGPILHVYLYG